MTRLWKIAAALLLVAWFNGSGGSGVWAEERTQTAPADRDDNQAALRSVLDKAIRAVGGQGPLKKLARITCRVKGVAVFPNRDEEREISFTASLDGLDRCRLDSMTAYNRDNIAIAVFKPEYKDLEGWLDRPVDVRLGSTLLPGAGFGHDLYALRLVQWLVPLQDRAFELSKLADLKVGERQTVGIKFGCKGRPSLDVFFDKETGLPAKAQMLVPVKDGGIEHVILDEYFFDAHKEVEGIQHFTKFTLYRDGKKRLEVELSDLVPQERFDDKIFSRP